MAQGRQQSGVGAEDFDALAAHLFAAARRFSKPQLLELADGLHDELRRRRGPDGRTPAGGHRSFPPPRAV